MGEIAETMLDGTMDPETGEWNFDGEDGPGFPMTGAEAAEWKQATGWRGDVYAPAKQKRRRFTASKTRQVARLAIRKALKHVGKTLSDREVDIFVNGAVREVSQ